MSTFWNSLDRRRNARRGKLAGRRRRLPAAGGMHVESLEPRALLAYTLPPSISSETVEIDENVVVADGSWSISATGGPSSDGHVQIFGNSRGRIDGTAGQSDEDLSIVADTFITVTGAIGATHRIDDLTLTSATAKPVNLQQAVSLTGDLLVTKAGSFTIGSTVDIDGNLTITDATNVMFSGNVTVDGNLTITNATSVLFAGTLTVGGQLTIVNVTGSTRFAGDVSVGSAAVTSTSLVQLQANFGSTGAAGAGDGDVTFTTDQIGFTTATIQSTAVSGPASAPAATLTVKPRTLNRALTIASPPGAPAGLNITDADLNAIRAGWKRVVLGDEVDGTGAVKVGSIGSQYGGFSQLLNTTTIVGGTIQVVQPVDVTPDAAYLELIARGTGAPGTGTLTISAPINQTVEERNAWVRLTSAGSISINAPIWSTQTVSLTTTDGGTITQGGSSAPISAGNLVVEAAGAVTLTDAGNAVDVVAFETSDDTVVFREDSGYSIGQIATTDSARDVPVSVTVTGINAGTATVRLATVSGSTASSVTQTEPVLAGALGLDGTGTTWTLTHASNDLVGILAANTGSVEFRDVDDLTIGTVAAVTPQSEISGITVARTLDVTAGTSLAITAAGDIVSSATSGTAVNLSAPSGIATAGDVTTAGGDVKFNHATTLTGDVTIDVEDGANKGTARFLSTANATTAGQQALVITGKLNACDSIGGSTALKSLSISNDATLAGSRTFRTTGGQTYSAAAT
ncbi:MAG: beta strand repeat-containing protein, partial [Planctomycetia bacterium]